MGSSVPGGTDSEALQGGGVKIWEGQKILCTIVENSVDWPANKSPPWAAYHEFMSGCLIALDKQTGVCPVRVGENWRHSFSKIVLKVTRLEDTMACKDDQMRAVIKVEINGTVQWVKNIWDEKSTTEDWIFLLVDTETVFKDIN